MKRMSRKTKNLLTVIGVVLIASFLIVALGKVSSGFQDWDTDNWQLRKPNEDNLYQSLTFNLMDGSKDTIDPGTYGVTVKLNEDDNTVKVKGTADGDATILIGTGVTLKANTSYLFDLGINNGSAKTIYMSVVNASTDEVIKSSYTGAVLITPTSDTAIKVTLTVMDETDVNVTLKPVICVGSDIEEDLISYWG